MNNNGMNTKGIALVTALIIMTVVGILVTGALFNSLTSLQVSGNDRNATLAQYVAQAGTTEMLTQANMNSIFVKDHYEDYGLGFNDETILGCSDGDFSFMGIDLDRIRDAGFNVAYDDGSVKEARTFDVVVGQPFQKNIVLPNGTTAFYTAQLDNNSVITVEGYVGQDVDNYVSRATNSIKFDSSGSGGYGNAIFVRGVNGPEINGNLSIYGSVHSVEDSGEGLDLSGTSGVYNTYLGEGSASDIQADIAGLGGNPEEKQLCTKVKLKTGNLRVGSNSAIVGSSTDRDADTELNEMAIGVYLEDGAKITDKNGGSVSSSLINTLEKTNNDWNLYNDNADLPELDSAYPNGGLTINPTNCPNLFQRVQGKDKFVLPPNNADTVSFTCGTGADTISWTGTPRHLVINGTINTGDYDILIKETQGQDKSPIYYTGKGTIRAGTSKTDSAALVEVYRSLLPVEEDLNNPGTLVLDTNDLDGDGDLTEPQPGQFVEDSIIGFVSSGDIQITKQGTPNVQVAALFYAENNVNVRTNATILGSIVADKIEAGQNVPKIAWDSRLKNPDNIPSGLPTPPTPVTAGAIGSIEPSVWEKR